MKLLGLVGLTLGYFGLKLLSSQLFFLLPLLFIFFITEKPAFFPAVVLTTIIDDLSAFMPLGFHLFSLSLGLTAVLALKKFIDLSKAISLGLALVVLLVVFIGFQASWYQMLSWPYLLSLFSFNFIYAVVFVSLYRLFA